ncbi:hypothetical protein DPMN_082204 [Dreissena polymorpha]|uniref:B(0,+)-type amino acid transporter 1 n=1 Tax=Dreissena polymorpha TaxID=45954 RepID=A0A9D4BIK5_DREPO|nr:hypothetical protein DPMN_082204 [Dreissena polymorpha]
MELTSASRYDADNAPAQTTNCTGVTQVHCYITGGRIRVKERIGLLGSRSFILGTVIGTGIFISPRGALLNSGSNGAALIVWAACGVMSIIIGLVYAELGVLLPKSGGDYYIIRSGFGDGPAFLCSWVSTAITNSRTKSLLALVFVDFLCATIFEKCKATDSLRKSIASIELLLIAITNSISVRCVTFLQSIFTLLKVAALVVITTGGFVYLMQGKVDNFDNAFAGTKTDVTSISLAVYSCIWAYTGYASLNDIVEEVVNQKEKGSQSDYNINDIGNVGIYFNKCGLFYCVD